MKFFKTICALAILAGATSSSAEAQNAPPESKGLDAFRRNVYQPILQNQCVKCHGNNGPGPNHSSEDINTSYQMVQRYTNFMDIKNSKFVIKGSNGHGNGYGGHVTITQDELIQALQKWWDQGENTAFLEGKTVLPAQVIGDLPQDGNYKTLSWNLGDVDPNLKGAKFQIDIQRFISAGEKTSGAYKLKEPRISTNGGLVEISSLNIIMNGIWDSSANNYASLNYTVSTQSGEVATLSPYKQIVLEIKGEGKDQIGFAFKTLKAAAPGSKITFVPDLISKKTGSSSEKVSLSKNPVFDESVVGKAGHFMSLKASAQNPIQFEMGSPENQANRSYDETLHRVKLTKSFEIQSTDVTQLQWYMVMKDTDMPTPSSFKTQTSCDPGNFMTVTTGTKGSSTLCKNHPVEQVSWTDSKEFIKRLNQMQNTYTYRLPTESEWEYMAKSGLPAEYPYGWSGDFDGGYAWSFENSKNQTHEVGTKKGIPSPQDPSELIYDMAGNVWQWVEDYYDTNYGLSADQLKVAAQDPTGASTGSSRVIRGGGLSTSAQDLRSGYRSVTGPGYRNYALGFRLVRTAR